MEGSRIQKIKPSNALGHNIVRALIPLASLIALLGMIYLWQSSQATMTGQRGQELQDKLERLRRENAQLEYEIAALTSPDKIAERARKLGLRPAMITQTTYTVLRNYSAAPIKPALPAGSPETVKNDNPIEFLWNELTTRLGLGPSPVEVGP
jgi:cell division protein FtsL